MDYIGKRIIEVLSSGYVLVDNISREELSVDINKESAAFLNAEFVTHNMAKADNGWINVSAIKKDVVIVEPTVEVVEEPQEQELEVELKVEEEQPVVVEVQDEQQVSQDTEDKPVDDVQVDIKDELEVDTQVID